MSTEQTSKIKSFLGTVAAGAAAVVGFILVQASEQLGQMGGAWLGPALFFPLIVVFLCCWIASKVLGPEYEHMKVAIGIVSAQAIMHVLGGLYFGPDVLLSVMPDVVILGGGVAWLIARPGVWPVALLLAFEAFAMVSTIVGIAQIGFEAEILKGGISSLLIRAAAIAFLYGAWRHLRAKPATAPETASV
jgi:hypothetical protein